MPLVGDVQAAGMTANVLAKRIADGLAEFMSNPTVSVQVKEVNSYYVYVLGEVQKPGKGPAEILRDGLTRNIIGWRIFNFCIKKQNPCFPCSAKWPRAT